MNSEVQMAQEDITPILDHLRARQMYRLIENCEDANVAIPSIFENWVP